VDPRPGTQASPDPGPLLDRIEHLCKADTTTGREDQGLSRLREVLAAAGASVEVHEAEPGRHNVLARWGGPARLLFSTPPDPVPPFIAPRRDGATVWGRGTCDAKGQIVSQLGAIARLREQGVDGLAWLGVVGEETDSTGARAAASQLAGRFAACRAVINGEPTENKLATGQRGSLQVRLHTTGVPCHSGMPELGRSAIWPLLAWLQRLRELPERSHPQLGPEIWNLGLLAGGEAPNVVPGHAEATLFVRAMPDSDFPQRAQALAPEGGVVDQIKHTPADLFPEIPGFPRAPVPFGSDAPRVRELVPGRKVALVGPGSIAVAHTAQERIAGADLLAGIDLLVRLSRALLAEDVR
jgi:acetylornithine deacetylase